jgi:hypothetical protein
MYSINFGDVTLWNLTELHSYFGEMYSFHLQARRVSRLILSGFFLGLPFDREDGESISLRNFSGLMPDHTPLCPKKTVLSNSTSFCETHETKVHSVVKLQFATNVKGGAMYSNQCALRDRSYWKCIFLFAAQPKEIFLAGLKKLEQRSHKCVELKKEYVN